MTLPHLIEASDRGVALVEWIEDRRAALEELLHAHGAVLFRGFAAVDVAGFERFAATFMRRFTDYEFALTPRLKLADHVATSTIFAPSLFLPWHGECCAQVAWPRYLAFGCQQAARAGGETVLVDARNLYARIAPEIRARFERASIRYVRTLFGTAELEFAFKTRDAAEIEQFCAARGYRATFVARDVVRTEIELPAVRAHPVTGQPVWFNAFHTYFASAHRPEVFHATLAAQPERFGVCFGDGEPIEPEVFDHVWAAYLAESVAPRWCSGDVLLVDNIAVAHGRNPFDGERSVIVAMGDP